MEVEVGKIVKFFAKPSVAAIEMTAGTLNNGDEIHIKGHTTDFTQVIESMQIDNDTVEEVKTGDMVGIRTSDRVREKDAVFKITPDD